MDATKSTLTIFGITPDNISDNFALVTIALIGVVVIVLAILSFVKFMSGISDSFSITFGKIFGLTAGGLRKKDKKSEGDINPQQVHQSQPTQVAIVPTATPKSALIPLNQHDFFNRVENLIRSGCFFIGDKSECRDETHEERNEREYYNTKAYLLRVFLTDYLLQVFYDRVLEFVNRLVLTNGACFGEAQALIWNIVDEYEQKAQRTIKLPDGRTVYGIPKTLVAKFKSWNSHRIDSIIEKVIAISRGSFYPSWQLKTIVFLEALDALITDLRKDADNTLLSLNGEVEEEISYIGATRRG